MTAVIFNSEIPGPIQNVSEKPEGNLNGKKLSIWTNVGNFVRDNGEALAIGIAVAAAIAGIVTLFVFFPEVMTGITYFGIILFLAQVSRLGES